MKFIRFVMMTTLFFWYFFGSAMEKNYHYTIEDVTNRVSDLQKLVKEGKEDVVNAKYRELEKIVNFLNEEAEEIETSDSQESGSEFCGDSYTEFIMLLNIALQPIRTESMSKRIQNMLK
ncbi:MAG: hypothetical protein IJ730_02015 [Alphaproteobacteria bacterium]|nr:hypothetical protein [Alphaproteobacteria bacterium]